MVQPGHPNRGGNPRGRDNRPPPPGLPQGYLANGYFDENGNLYPEVIQKWPMEIARAFRQSRPQLNTTQLRRFFNKVCDIKLRLDAGQSFDSLKEQIYTLGPMAAASVGRETAPQIFKDFIDQNVQLATQSSNHLRRGFKTHFESIIAYVKYLEKKSAGR